MLQALSRHLSATFGPTHTNIYAHKHTCNRSQNPISVILEHTSGWVLQPGRRLIFLADFISLGLRDSGKEIPSVFAISFLPKVDGLGD